MRYQFICFLILSLAFVRCNSETDKQAGEESSEQYAYIKNIAEEGEETQLDLDYVEYLTGDKAFEAARKAGDLDSTLDEEGNIEASVTNDYYIVNDDKSTIRIPLASDCEYSLILEMDRLSPIKDNSLESLKKIYKDNLFLLKIDRGAIVSVTEVFIP